MTDQFDFQNFSSPTEECQQQPHNNVYWQQDEPVAPSAINEPSQDWQEHSQNDLPASVGGMSTEDWQQFLQQPASGLPCPPFTNEQAMTEQSSFDPTTQQNAPSAALPEPELFDFTWPPADEDFHFNDDELQNFGDSAFDFGDWAGDGIEDLPDVEFDPDYDFGVDAFRDGKQIGDEAVATGEARGDEKLQYGDGKPAPEQVSVQDTTEQYQPLPQPRSGFVLPDYDYQQQAQPCQQLDPFFRTPEYTSPPQQHLPQQLSRKRRQAETDFRPLIYGKENASDELRQIRHSGEIAAALSSQDIAYSPSRRTNAIAQPAAKYSGRDDSLSLPTLSSDKEIGPSPPPGAHCYWPNDYPDGLPFSRSEMVMPAVGADLSRDLTVRPVTLRLGQELPGSGQRQTAPAMATITRAAPGLSGHHSAAAAAPPTTKPAPKSRIAKKLKDVQQISVANDELLIYDLQHAKSVAIKHRPLKLDQDDRDGVAARPDIWIPLITAALDVQFHLAPDSPDDYTAEGLVEWTRWQTEHAHKSWDLLANQPHPIAFAQACAYIFFETVLEAHAPGSGPREVNGTVANGGADARLKCSDRMKAAIRGLERFTIARYDLLRLDRLHDFVASPKGFCERKINNMWTNYRKKPPHVSARKVEDAGDGEEEDGAKVGKSVKAGKGGRKRKAGAMGAAREEDARKRQRKADVLEAAREMDRQKRRVVDAGMEE